MGKDKKKGFSIKKWNELDRYWGRYIHSQEKVYTDWTESDMNLCKKMLAHQRSKHIGEILRLQEFNKPIPDDLQEIAVMYSIAMSVCHQKEREIIDNPAQMTLF